MCYLFIFMHCFLFWKFLFGLESKTAQQELSLFGDTFSRLIHCIGASLHFVHFKKCHIVQASSIQHPCSPKWQVPNKHLFLLFQHPTGRDWPIWTISVWISLDTIQFQLTNVCTNITTNYRIELHACLYSSFKCRMNHFLALPYAEKHLICKYMHWVHNALALLGLKFLSFTSSSASAYRFIFYRR